MRLLTCLALICLLAIAAFAQSDRGSITGTVLDAAGAAVPNANVTATNTNTQAVYETVTTDTGNYTLAQLPAGVYSLKVTASGFSAFVQQGIRIQVAQTARIEVKLQVGSTSESVTVTADAPLLKVDSSEQSFNLSTERINAMPNFTTNLRSPFAFAMIMPGVVGRTGNPAGTADIRVNGSPNTSYRVLVDGQDITSTNFDPSHTLEQQPAVEALEEFTLQASNYAAEFGQITGGLFNFTTKSGTNTYHGSAFMYYRNEFLNAGRPFTDDGTGEHLRPKSRRANYGFTTGGPVIIPKLYNGRNRTFFFFNLELYRNTSATDDFSTVPTVRMRNGDFSEALTGRRLGTDSLGRPIMENTIYDPLSGRSENGQIVSDPFVGNAIPMSRFDPVSAKIQSLIPMPTRDGVLLNWRRQFTSPDRRDIPSIKIDHYLSSKLKFAFYLSRTKYSAEAQKDALPVPITRERDRVIGAKTARLSFDYTVSPRLLINGGIGYVRALHDDGYLAEVKQFDPAAEWGLIGSHTIGTPAMTGLSSNTGGGAPSMGMGNYQQRYTDKPTAVLSATFVRGNHTYKSGVQWRNDPNLFKQAAAVANYTFSANQTALPYLQTTNVGGGSIGLPYASFLLGTVNNANVPALAAPHYRKDAWGFFIQDTWKITRKLTFDYGLRWDYQQAPHEINFRNGMFGPTVPNPAAGGLLGAMVYEGYGQGRCNCRFTDTYPYAIGPRLGLAYQITPRWVLRAGWGIQYGNTPDGGETTALGVGWNTVNFTPQTFGDAAANLRTGLRYDVAQLYAISLDPGLRPSPGQIDSPPYFHDRNGGRPPRMNQWNVSLQREITRNLVVEAAYVANRAVWLQANGLVDLNALTPERIAPFGLNINNAADRQLLRSTLSSSTATSRGFNRLPYPGYPAGQTVAQSLRPFPQYGNINVRFAPLGKNWYDSMQVKVTKRASHNLDITGAFTWSKTLTLNAEDFDGGGPTNDVFNRANQKALSAGDQPFVFVTSFNYRVPRLGPNRWARALLGDWTISGVLSYASGLPIQVPAAQNNLGQLLPRNVNPATSPVTFANRVPGEPLFTKDPNGHIDPNADFILNPRAWSDPADGQWGYAASYYSDYRQRRQPNEQLGIGRIFPLGEGRTLEVRAEFFNSFNRIVLPTPTSTNALATQQTNPQTNVPTAGFGFINANSVGGQRSGQLLARFQF